MSEADEAVGERLAEIAAVAIETSAMRAQLDAQDRLTKVIAENATLGLCVMDERQHCTYLNPAAERMFGYTLDEVRARNVPLHDIVHHTRPDGTHYPMQECPIDRAFPERAREQGEDVFIHPDGHFYPVAFTASPIFDGTEPVGTVIEVRDIREEKRLDQQRAEQHLAVETLLRTSQTILGKLELKALLGTLTDEATRLSGAQFGAFFYNATDRLGDTYVLYTISGVDPERFADFPHPRPTALFGPTFRGEGVVRLDDVTADPRFGKNEPYRGMPPGHLPVRSYLAVPVKDRSGEVLGGLFFGHEEVGVFTERAEELIVGVANQAGVALDNARLYEQARRARELEELRARVQGGLARAMTVGEGLAERLHLAMRVLVHEIGAAFARIWIIDETGQTLVLRGSAGMYTHLDGDHARVPVGELKIGKIAAGREPHLTNDVATDPWISDPEWAAREGMVAFAGYPLVLRGEVLGVMALFAREKLHSRVIDILSGVADQLALGIERDAIEQEREAFRELFLGMLGHDLRNPLSAVITGSQLMRESLDNPAVLARSVERVERSARRMRRMVDQLLDFARSTNGGTIPLSRHQERLDSICRDVLEELRQAHPDREIRGELAGAEGFWDRDRMAQVFSNLVGNAIAHGAADRPITVTIEADGQTAVFAVHNFGPVIEAEEREMLFELHRRATHGKTSTTSGLGLGLYITAQIVKAHGGTIDVHSTQEDGTRFRVELPQRRG